MASAKFKQIYGIGIDIITISRIQRIHEKYGDRFLYKAYHKYEIEIFNNNKKYNVNKYSYLASRWAVKEAMQKAISSPRLLFPEIFVTTPNSIKGENANSHNNKRPVLNFEGKTAEICKELNICSSHVSISHEEDKAIANVILEQIIK